MDDIELDLRHLPPPEPLIRILDALASLPVGRRLCAYTPCRPQPLLDTLDARGFAWEVEVAPGGDACVLIRHRDDRAGD